MRKHRSLTLMAITGLLIFGGCGSSDQSASKDQSSPSSSAGQQQTTTPAGTVTSQRSDTVKTQGYDPHSSVPALVPAGKFGVQVGAYKQQENADRVASMAKDRFGRNVYTIPDAASSLVKVYVGDFASKDEARKFRDEMALKYPADYKDAWVSEIPAK